MLHRYAVLAAFGSCLAFSAPALAGDLNPPPGPVAPTPGPNAGVVVNSTNTPGDAFAMFVISAPGKYRLGAGFDIANGLSGIRITAPDVWLDLGGFTISSTSPEPIAGNGIVIDVTGVNSATVTIENGAVTGYTSGVFVANFPSNAASHIVLDKVNLTRSLGSGLSSTGAHSIRLREVTADDNHSSGINAPNSRVNAISVHASNNDMNGIVAGPKSNLETVEANDNDGHGVVLGAGSAVAKANANDNGASGISAPGGDVRVGDFTANGNAVHGVDGTTNMSLRNGQTTGNGQSGVNINSGLQDSVTNRGNQKGISATGAVRIRDSRMNGNSSFGADVGPNSAIDNSEMNNNADGARLGDGSTVSNSGVHNNTDDGIEGNEHISIINTTICNNADRGVNLGQFAFVSHSQIESSIIAVSVAGGSRVTDNIIAKSADGLQINGPAVVENNTLVANGNGLVVFNNGSGTMIRGNTFKASGGPGVLLNANNCVVLANYFRDNATHVQNNGAMNKIAPIQCDPLTAGTYDNWALETMR